MYKVSHGCGATVEHETIVERALVDEYFARTPNTNVDSTPENITAKNSPLNLNTPHLRSSCGLFLIRLDVSLIGIMVIPEYYGSTYSVPVSKIVATCACRVLRQK